MDQGLGFERDDAALREAVTQSLQHQIHAVLVLDAPGQQARVLRRDGVEAAPHVVEAQPGARAGGGAALVVARIRHAYAQLVALPRRMNAHLAAFDTIRDPVFHRVLDQRLQHEGRHQAPRRILAHLDPAAQAAAEAHALDAEILLDQGHLLAERHALARGERERAAQEVTKPLAHAARALGIEGKGEQSVRPALEVALRLARNAEHAADDREREAPRERLHEIDDGLVLEGVDQLVGQLDPGPAIRAGDGDIRRAIFVKIRDGKTVDRAGSISK